MNKRTIILLTAILLTAFVLRTISLSTVPAGFFCDEASIGYNAYTMWQTGMDEYGVLFPIFFRSLGDFRPPIPFYSAVPFVAVFGLTEWAVRLPSAVAGTLTVLLLFLFLRALFLTLKKSDCADLVGLIGAGLLAVSPWHIHFSRLGTENIYLPLFVLLSAWLFLESVKRPRYIIPATVSAFAICYTYLPGIIIGPLFFVSSILIVRPSVRWNKRLLIIVLLCSLCLSAPIIRAWTDGTLRTRWEKIGITKTDGIRTRIESFGSRYISHFSPAFLVTKGDADYPGHFITRYGTKEQGQLYLPDVVFGMIGILWCIVLAFRFPVALYPILFLLLYPIGGSVTVSDGAGPFAFRSVLGSVAFPVVSAIGITRILTWIRKRNLKYIAVVAIFFIYYVFAWRYLYLYFFRTNEKTQDYWGWQYGARPIMAYFLTHEGEYDRLYMQDAFNAPEIFLKFYDPTNRCHGKCAIGTPDAYRDPTKRQLFAVSASREKGLTDEFIRKETIYYPNGQPAFSLGTYPSVP